MTIPLHSMKEISSAWEVLTLFIIPVGGGIPGGVLLAKSRDIDWIGMTILYFISDVMLACVFEPLMLLIIAGAKRVAWLDRAREAMRKSMAKTTARYGTKMSPLALVGVSFGVDPMTGRVAAAASGHGFIAGWLIAITGDMFYFGILMASTLWLHEVLGDGTVATLIILVVMMVVPPLFKRLRGGSQAPDQQVRKRV